MSDFDVNNPDAYPEHYFVTDDGTLDDFDWSFLDDDEAAD